MIFTQDHGTRRVWVPESEVDWWIGFYAKEGAPVVRWRDYHAWGGFFPPHPESVGDAMFYPDTRRRRHRRSR